MTPLAIREIDRLPQRVNPRPVVEAVFEIRYVPDRDPSLLPGLFHAAVCKRYPKVDTLPAYHIPEEFRQATPDFTYQAHHVFHGDKFRIQFGPRVISLVTHHDYPGWSSILPELEWLIGRLKDTSFLSGAERLGTRYINFFSGDVTNDLVIGLHADGQKLQGNEMTFTTIFDREEFRGRLVVNNMASILRNNEAESGTIIDLDLWLGASQFSLFETGITRFEEAHRLNKEVFFGLLKDEFLDSLNPEYG